MTKLTTHPEHVSKPTSVPEWDIPGDDGSSECEDDASSPTCTSALKLFAFAISVFA